MEPQRTCLGCRRSTAQSTLVRLCWQEPAGVVVDADQRLGGRGCYVHPACAEEALRRRAIGRALRRSVEPAQVAAAVAGLVRRDVPAPRRD